MARYKFGTVGDLRAGQTGRSNFSKAFKDRLLEHCGAVDCITNVVHPSRLLQIDHRIPFRVLGDDAFRMDDVDAFMLLDAKSQRAKSWSCEQCRNFVELREPGICRRCFWAFPEDYDHIAMRPQRRCDIVWEGDEVVDYDRLAEAARLRRISLAELLKLLGREQIAD